MNDPPFDIVDRIIQISLNLPSHKDIYGQFPLHTVLALGVASWSVVEMLVNHNIDATETCDNTGMTPLMLACRDMIPDDEAIIFSLLAVCPYVINVENENEMSAMHFALLSDCCSMEVMGYLIQASDEEILMSEEGSQ
jgi:ankyrin repeat protein